jgi:hypothetical protein
MIAYNFADAEAETYIRFEIPLYDGIPEFQFAYIDFTLITPFPEGYSLDMSARLVEFFSPSLEFSMTGTSWFLTLPGIHLFGDSLRQIPEPGTIGLILAGLFTLLSLRRT